MHSSRSFRLRSAQRVVKSMRTCRPVQIIIYQVHLRLPIKTISQYVFGTHLPSRWGRLTYLYQYSREIHYGVIVCTITLRTIPPKLGSWSVKSAPLAFSILGRYNDLCLSFLSSLSWLSFVWWLWWLWQWSSSLLYACLHIHRDTLPMFKL